jgi:hypothetical protein
LPYFPIHRAWKKRVLAELQQLSGKFLDECPVKNRRGKKCPGIRLKAIVAGIIFHVGESAYSGDRLIGNPEIPIRN